MRRTKLQPRFRPITEDTRKEKALKENGRRRNTACKQQSTVKYMLFLRCIKFLYREAREKEQVGKALREEEEQKSNNADSTCSPDNKDEEETKAAVVLQSNYRGYKERKRFKERKKAAAELDSPANPVVEDEDVKQSSEEQEEQEEGKKSTENDEEEEPTIEADENDDSDHTQVPEDDEHTVVDATADVLTPDVGKEAQVEDKKDENDQESIAAEELGNMDEETRAATVIQSNFRGHKERKRLQEEGKIPGKKHKNKIPTGEENVPEAEDPANDVKNEDPDETKAAVVIQSNFRGHKERKRLEEEGKMPKRRKQEKESSSLPPEDEQVTHTEERVQDVPAENTEGMDEEKAATVLQSNFRGQRDRKRLKAEREEQQSAKEDAVMPCDGEAEEKALDLTDVVIEHKEEADAEQQRVEEEQAAVTIQSHFRGYKERKNLKTNKPSPQKEAEQLQSFSKEVTAFIVVMTLSHCCFHSWSLCFYIASADCKGFSGLCCPAAEAE